MKRNREGNRRRSWAPAWIGLVAIALVAGGHSTADAKGKKKVPGAKADIPEGAREKIERVKAELGLDDDTAEALFVVVREHRKSMKPLREQLKEVRIAMEEALAAEVPNEKRVHDLLTTFELNRKAAEAERWLLFERMDEILTPSQKAKFIRIMLRRRLKMMKGAKGKRGKGPGRFTP